MAKSLSPFMYENLCEIGIDEAGRGPLFGRVYVAATILPKDNTFQYVKDSKKYTSKKKIGEMSDFIKEHAIAWHITYVEADVIDVINIRQAVLQSMHECVNRLLTDADTMILVDGSDFTPHTIFENDEIRTIPHTLVVGGDNKYTAIAAASVLAKVARDEYIMELCKEYPELEKYGIHTNMGYGTKVHLDAIREHGITQWHRRTYGALCKNAVVNKIE